MTRAGSDPGQEAVVELTAADLPAYCPNPNMPLWSSHPRVFLDLSEGQARCPYCGTVYRLAAGHPPTGAH
ncbi:MAG: zinc-finger domain-containing protein [Burkholderiaceae bacterium]